MAIVPFVELQLAAGFRPPAIERLLRVQGDSTRRIAEQEGAWWNSEVIEPAMAAGKGPEEIANADLADRIAPLSEQAVLAMYHAQQARAWTANIIEGVRGADGEGRDPQPPSNDNRRSASSISADTRGSPRNAATMRPLICRRRSRGWCSAAPCSTAASRSSGWATA